MSSIDSRAISFLLEHVDQVGAHLVAQTYQNLVNHYAAVMYSFTAIYISLVFIKMQRGHYDGNDFIMLVLRAVIILTLAMNYDYFCLYLYDIFTNEPLNICQAITINGNSVGSVSISHSLDNFLNGGKEAAGRIFSMGSWNNPTYFFFGGIVFFLVLTSAASATGLIILAKCASTILFALSPIFIFFALFDATKGLFDAFIRQLITYALIPIMTCAVLMILLSVAESATGIINNTDKPNLAHLMPLGLMCIIQIYLLLQVKSKCSAISGGFSLPSVISALRQSKSELGSVGKRISNMAGSALRGVGSAAQLGNKAGQFIKQRLSRFSKA